MSITTDTDVLSITDRQGKAAVQQRIRQLEERNATLVSEIDRMRLLVDAVIGHKRDLGFRFPIQIEAAIEAYETNQSE